MYKQSFLFKFRLLLLPVAFWMCQYGYGQMGRVLPPNHLQYPAGTYTIPFEWLGDSTGAGWEPQSALLLPVSFAGSSEIFYMQLDLGSPYSIVYSNMFETVRSKINDFRPEIDSSGEVHDFRFHVGEIPVHAVRITTMAYPEKSAGNSSGKKPASVIIVGTIGSDLIDKKVFIIDYHKRKIKIEEDLSAHLKAKMVFENFMYVNRSILLPASINNKKTMLFFDTGSSAFELLTSKATAKELAAPGATTRRYEVRSWEKMMTAFTSQSNATIEMGSAKIPVQNVTYMEGASTGQIEMMMKLGIGGMTGNKLFQGRVLVLDTRNKLFAVGPDSGKTD